MARVAVVFTGGTISTVFDPVAGGNVPTLDGAAILARTPGLDCDRRRRRHRPRPDAGEPLHVPGPARHRRGRARRARGSGGRRRGRRPGHRHHRGDGLLLGPRARRTEAGRRDRRDARLGRRRASTGRPTCATRSVSPPDPRCATPASWSASAGSIEPADDVAQDAHLVRSTTFASPNGGSLGRVDGGARGGASGDAPGGAHVATVAGRGARPPHHRDRGDGRLAARRGGRGRRGRDRRRRDRCREHRSARCWRRRSGRWTPGIPVALASRCPAGRGRGRVRVPGRRCDVGPGGRDPGRSPVRGRRPASRSRSGSVPGSTAPGWPLCWPTRRPDVVPLDDAHHRADRDARR